MLSPPTENFLLQPGFQTILVSHRTLCVSDSAGSVCALHKFTYLLAGCDNVHAFAESNVEVTLGDPLHLYCDAGYYYYSHNNDNSNNNNNNNNYYYYYYYYYY